VKFGLALLLVSALCAGGTPNGRALGRAVGTFASVPLPYLPGSTIPIHVDGLTGAYRVGVLGPGSIDGGEYRVPDLPLSDRATLVAGNAVGLAMHTFDLAPASDASAPFIAVASYDDDGVVLHDAAPPYRMRAIFSIGGPPGDVAIDDAGRLATAQTDGETAYVADLAPWRVSAFGGVLLADEVAFDERTHALFVTDRDVNGAGALTRIDASGAVARRVLGLTAEGIAIDAVHGRVYVANVNDGTVSEVDATTLVELRRFRAVSRAFSLALSPNGSMLYVVSNQSRSSPFARAGSVVALDLRSRTPRIVARSKPLAFPVGIAYDPRRGHLLVTDELDDVVYVLDARTLRAVHAPVKTCATPWKPAIDNDRLYVPCARANEIDVIELPTLKRAPDAPFKTGGYPLSVAVWPGRRS
jgi:hypothetical protein